MTINNMLGLMQFYPIHLVLIVILVLSTILVSWIKMRIDDLRATYYDLSEPWWNENQDAETRWNTIIANIHMRAFLMKCLVICRLAQALTICLIIGISF